MSMELRGTHGGLLWWLLGYELVAWFGSTGLDLPIGIAVFSLRGVVVQPRHNQWSEHNLAPPGGFSPNGRQRSWNARWSRHEVGGRDPCGRRSFWLHDGAVTLTMWLEDLQRTDVTCSLCTSFLSRCPPQQPRLRWFMILLTSTFKGTCHARGWATFFKCARSCCCHSILPDADVFWYWFVPHHKASVTVNMHVLSPLLSLMHNSVYHFS
jgi:hypothetical protein